LRLPRRDETKGGDVRRNRQRAAPSAITAAAPIAT